MTYLLRRVRKGRWLPEPWLPPDSAPGDQLKDFNTDNHEFSLYRLAEDAHLHRVVTAIAAARETLSNLDYAVVDEDVVRSLNVTLKESSGLTPDPEVNAWHVDAVELTTAAVFRVADSFWQNGMPVRLLPADVRELIVKALTEQRFSKSDLAESLVRQLNLQELE